MEDADERLGSLYDEFEEASYIRKKNEDERKKADRFLAYQCYLMCWNRNKAIQLWDLNGESVGDNISWVDGVKILTKLCIIGRRLRRNRPFIVLNVSGKRWKSTTRD